MTRQELRAYWQQKIEEQKQSGINIAAWCRENSLNNKTFRRWKRNLKSTSAAIPEGWCQVQAAPVTKSTGSLTLVVDERISIELTTGFDHQLLKDVLSVIGS